MQKSKLQVKSQNWPTKKLGEVCEIEYGTRIVKSRTEPGQYYVYGSGGKTFETVNYNRESRIIIARFAMSPNCVRRIQGRFFLNDSGLTLSPKNRAKLTQDFLDTFLFSIENKIFSLGRGQAQKNLNIGEFINLPIPLPPITEQKRIVEKIEKLFAKIDEANRLRAESSAASAALLHSALHKIFSRTEKERWPTKKLGEILDYEQPSKYIVSSKNYSNDYKTPVLTAGKTFILGNTNEKNGIFPKEKLPVIIFDDFTTASKFVDFPFKVKSSAMKILHPKKDLVNAKYVFYKMKTIDFSVTQHKRYWISKYSKIEIPLPPIAEQKKIVAYLDALSQKTLELQNLQTQTAADFSALRQSVLAKAFKQL